MKKSFVMAVAAMVAVLTACSSESEELRVNGEASADAQKVTLTFSPYEMSAMTRTRAAVSIAEVASKLDVWIYQGGTEAAAVHQTSADDGFGSVSMTLDKTKTYTLYACAHRASGAATLTNGVVAWPDDKVTHALFYTTTFSPATTTTLTCEMERIVGMFTLVTTDVVPAEVSRMVFGLGESPTRWNVAGYGVNPQERTSAYSSISRKADGTASLSVYAIADGDEAVDHTITVTAYDADGEQVQQRVFADVPIRNGYRTQYQGAFFIDAPMAMSFTVDDWQDLDVVEF